MPAIGASSVVAAIDSAALRSAHDGYHRRFGWPTVLEENRLTLPLGNGICALAMDELLGCDLAAALSRAGCRGPVFAVPGMTSVRWLFLAEADGTVQAREDTDVRLLPSSLAVPLPPTITPHGQVRWIYRPRVDQRWLPTCSTILDTVRISLIRTRPGRAG